LADEDLFETITRRINGGLNGYQERCHLWDLAKKALGVD
jgi:putative chitinase